jgi:general nucleoside transport system ATP-binding protein
MLIKLNHISKTFGSVRANQNISVTFNSGRIIGVLGENGAGKSTLMKILSGYQPADSGEIWLDGALVDYDGPQAALAHGIGMLQQDPLDVAAFTVLENFIYGQPRRDKENFWQGFFMPRRTAEKTLRDLCARFGFALDPNLPIAQLSIAQRQQLEIIRLLAQGIRALILDEPTTGISADQKDILFATLRELAQNGMTILLVSHKLEDVLTLCDEVIVLRAGKLVGVQTLPVTKQALVTMMFGQELAAPERIPKDLSSAPVVFEMRDVILSDGRLHIDQFHLGIRAGEVIGLAGLDGSGQELLMRAAAGLIKLRSGNLILRGDDVTAQPYHHLLPRGVVFGAAGRLEEGLIAGLTLQEHFALAKETSWFVDRAQAKTITEEKIAHYNIRGRGEDTIERLSGGNQQRVLMAMLPDTPTLMILEQPTRGLDVDSAAWIWEQLRAACQRGAALLFSSADLDELIAYSDRIIVCFAGHTYIVEHPDHMNVNTLGHFIGGEFD